MPDPGPARMWGVWDTVSNHFIVFTRDETGAMAFVAGFPERRTIIPGTFTPDEEGSDEQD